MSGKTSPGQLRIGGLSPPGHSPRVHGRLTGPPVLRAGAHGKEAAGHVVVVQELQRVLGEALRVPAEPCSLFIDERSLPGAEVVTG